MKPLTTTLFLFLTTITLGQTLKDVEIESFNEPYQTIVLNIDNRPVEYEITEKTKYKSKKSNDVPTRYFKSGSYVDIDYKIEGRSRVANSIKLLSDYTPGKEKVKGILESFEKNIAYIDGRKVILDGSTKIECEGSEKCGCTKGMIYLGYDELRLGDFLEVKGEVDQKGGIIANEIEVCQNNKSETDEKLRSIVEASFNDTEAKGVVAPSSIMVPPNSLHQGKIVVGAVEYTLAEDIRLQGYVNMIGNKVLPAYAKSPEYKERHDIFYRFYVLNNPIPNAFAFPNGMVFITTGLLKIIENEAQLAIVLGHELAHITYKHGAERMEKNEYFDNNIVKSSTRVLVKELFDKDKSTGIKGGILDGLEGAILATKPSDISNLFNQDFETQADRVGLFYAFDAGYDIRQSLDFWRTMAEQTKNEDYIGKLKDDFKDIFFSINVDTNQNLSESISEDITQKAAENYLDTVYTSHPNCKKRVRDINDLLNTVYAGEYLDLTIGDEKYKTMVQLD